MAEKIPKAIPEEEKKEPIVETPSVSLPPSRAVLPSGSTYYDNMFKVIIIGNPCCGKTSLLLRASEGKRNENYEVTVGVDCKSRTFNYKDKRVKLQFWDTAGQERFTKMTTSYYRGAYCCVLVFDITNPDSFFSLFKWID